MNDVGRSLVLSFDFEDWNQKALRNLGHPDWDRPHAAFEGQVAAILDVLDELDVKATFFVLGMCAHNYPDAVRELAARGHEIGSHGYAHERVYRQTPDEFRADVLRSIEVIDDLVGQRPVGYRAPEFSITRASTWAFDVLAELEFRYDSSQYDSPRIPGRLGGIPLEPYRLELAGGKNLVEFPVAVVRIGRRAIPIGGGTYWRVLPARVLFPALRAVAAQSPAAVLYFHPYELDPHPLRLRLPGSAPAAQRIRAMRYNVYWNARRARIARLLRRVGREFRLVSYESYLANGDAGAHTKTLSREGVVV